MSATYSEIIYNTAAPGSGPRWEDQLIASQLEAGLKRLPLFSRERRDHGDAHSTADDGRGVVDAMYERKGDRLDRSTSNHHSLPEGIVETMIIETRAVGLPRFLRPPVHE